MLLECDAQDCRHIQQNSWPHPPDRRVHVMWLQPWFFSIGLWHLGHGFVFAKIHVTFSDSLEFFKFHFAADAHDTDGCDSSKHCQHQRYLHPHVMKEVGQSRVMTWTAESHPAGFGHHFTSFREATKY